MTAPPRPYGPRQRVRSRATPTATSPRRQSRRKGGSARKTVALTRSRGAERSLVGLLPSPSCLDTRGIPCNPRNSRRCRQTWFKSFLSRENRANRFHRMIRFLRFYPYAHRFLSTRSASLRVDRSPSGPKVAGETSGLNRPRHMYGFNFISATCTSQVTPCKCFTLSRLSK